MTWHHVVIIGMVLGFIAFIAYLSCRFLYAINIAVHELVTALKRVTWECKNTNADMKRLSDAISNVEELIK